MRIFSTFAILFYRAISLAAEGGHGGGDHDHIPYAELIYPQAFNFSLVAIGLIYLLRKPLKEYFATRAQTFVAKEQQAALAKQEAEKLSAEMRAKIKSLDDNAQRNIDEAKSEAATLQKQLVVDAEVQAKRSLDEAGRMAAYELDRAIATLREELVTNSVRFAENKMKTDSRAETQGRLNAEAIKKVQAVKL